jgi:hypothetical protein
MRTATCWSSPSPKEQETEGGGVVHAMPVDGLFTWWWWIKGEGAIWPQAPPHLMVQLKWEGQTSR